MMTAKKPARMEGRPPRMTRYFGAGRKCRLCNCYFVTDEDYEAHMETHWKKTHDGSGEWLPAEGDPELARMISVAGSVTRNGYKYVLIADGKIIYRKKMQY